MKTQTGFQNSSLVSVVNGFIVVKDSNCFRTEKQAEKAAEKVKELFKSL